MEFSFEKELEEFVEGRSLIQKQLHGIQETQAKLQITTLENVTFNIDWTIADGMKITYAVRKDGTVYKPKMLAYEDLNQLLQNESIGY